MLIKKPKLSTIVQFGSVMCIIHCLLVPIILVAMPLVSAAVPMGEMAELAFVATMYALALINLILGLKSHSSGWPLALIFLGMSSFVIAHSVDGHNTSLHIAFMILSSGFLILAQIVNARLCKCKCHHKCESDFEVFHTESDESKF